MGLAASQARFLGITLRKANCEFRSTELAQQKLQLTDQMSRISEEYSTAINATKLTWVNEAADADYGVTYGLLMMPSAANNYNPYMITTRSGAVVLNSEYQAAAMAAGISMAGTIPSEEGYKKFIYALGDGMDASSPPKRVKDANGNDIVGQNLITRTTQNTILNYDSSGNPNVNFHKTAGLGAIPKDKTSASQMTINDLANEVTIGGQIIDWLQVYRVALGYEYDDKATNGNYNAAITEYDNKIALYKRRYANAKDPAKAGTGDKENFGSTRAKEAETNAKKAVAGATLVDGYLSITEGTDSNIMKKFVELEQLIAKQTNTAMKTQYTNELNNYIKGLNADGNPIGATPTEQAENKVKNQLFWAIYEKAKFEAVNSSSTTSNIIQWDSNSDAGGTASSIGFNRIFYTGTDARISGNDRNNTLCFTTIPDPDGTGEVKSDLYNNIFTQLNVYINDMQQRTDSAIKSLTVADLLRNDIVIMTQINENNPGAGSGCRDGSNQDTAIKSVEVAGKGVLDYIARVFGYGSIGTGLNVDSTTDEALKTAYTMTIKKFIDARGAVTSGDKADDSDPHNNSAFINANNFNKIGVMHSGCETYAALNLSNMVSAFLTYYDNALRGADSEYVVGKGNDGGNDGGAKTYFVTDDPNYVYITTAEDDLSTDEKLNDFYNELYNNICQHGWRYDGNLDDYQYLETAIKNGKYSISALTSDGYFYQQRYNEIEYLVEEQDRDAIARAEADFTRKKAEITVKEDRIDIQTRKLDAEISELTTELNSVQNLISKSIEKTFALFSN